MATAFATITGQRYCAGEQTGTARLSMLDELRFGGHRPRRCLIHHHQRLETATQLIIGCRWQRWLLHKGVEELQRHYEIAQDDIVLALSNPNGTLPHGSMQMLRVSLAHLSSKK